MKRNVHIYQRRPPVYKFQLNSRSNNTVFVYHLLLIFFFNMSNTTGASSGAGVAYLSETPELTPGFK
jgi:hypothetical protein